MKVPIIVSACLLGVCCRFDGKSKPCGEALSLLEQYQLIPVCPESYGGLPIPRSPSEICAGRVLSKEGNDVTDQYQKGAEQVLRLARLYGCKAAVLKENSPSCGIGKIYDGTFTKTLTDGDGVTAALLQDHGIAVFTEKQTAFLKEMFPPFVLIESDGKNGKEKN